MSKHYYATFKGTDYVLCGPARGIILTYTFVGEPASIIGPVILVCSGGHLGDPHGNCWYESEDPAAEYSCDNINIHFNFIE